MKGYTVIIGIVAAIVLVLVTLSVFFQRTLRMETAEQFNKEQLLTATAEASNIQNYLDGKREQLLHIARLVSLLKIRKETEFTMLTTGVFANTGNVKKRIEFLDRGGEILYGHGNVHAEVPQEKDIIASLKKTPCPGNVIMQQDTRILTLAAPVCRYDSFEGAVMISLDVQDIGKEFLGTMKSESRGYAWMMDEHGFLLYHPTQSDMVGRNLYKTDSSCFKCHKTFEAEKKIVEGRGDYCSGDYYGRYVAPTGEDKILAYSSAMAGNMRWIVAVTAPYSEVTMSINRSMKIYTWIIIVIFMMTVAVSAMMFVSNWKREKAEELAKHEKELEMMHAERLASLERLTSGITAEIGNPLTSIFSFLRVLMDREEDELKSETLETIFFHMNRIGDILKQLSGFSKIQSLELKPCKVNGVIEDSLSLIQYDTRVQNITIVRDLSPGIPSITTDGNQLSQVIVNIVLNAADAMPNGGTLTIGSRVKDGGVVIDFQDTGVGIDKDNLKRIFDPFYTTKDRGTGLGLAASYNIVKNLKGTLTAESEPGKGSRFVITLPVG